MVKGISTSYDKIASSDENVLSNDFSLTL